MTTARLTAPGATAGVLYSGQRGERVFVRWGSCRKDVSIFQARTLKRRALTQAEGPGEGGKSWGGQETDRTWGNRMGSGKRHDLSNRVGSFFHSANTY